MPKPNVSIAGYVALLVVAAAPSLTAGMIYGRKPDSPPPLHAGAAAQSPPTAAATKPQLPAPPRSRVLAGTTPVAPANSSSAANLCQVTIDQPSAGAKVGKKALVEGTAKIPPSSYLWGFVEVAGIAGYYPQGGGAARIANNGHWRVLAHFGTADDIGSEFVMHMAVVDNQTNQALRNWVRTASAKRSWEPIDSFVSVVDGCPIRTVTITKTSD